MSKATLINHVYDATRRSKAPPTKATIEEIVNVMFNPHGIAALLRQNGNKITIPSFGTFERKRTAARVARNPATGAPIQVPEKFKISFRASPTLQSCVD